MSTNSYLRPILTRSQVALIEGLVRDALDARRTEYFEDLASTPDQLHDSLTNVFEKDQSTLRKLLLDLEEPS